MVKKQKEKLIQNMHIKNPDRDFIIVESFETCILKIPIGITLL